MLPPVRLQAELAKKVILKTTGPKASIAAKDWASFKKLWCTASADAINERHVRREGLKRLA